MTANYLSDLRSNSARLPLSRNTTWRHLCGLTFFLTLASLVSVSTAQETKTEPTLVPGSEVNLDAIKAADWLQGEGPTAFEPGKVYVFECWATWCPPCIALIPHVNELHKKYYDKGLRVHGMSWENDKDPVKAFVKKKGAGMSYPVALAVEGSAFEKQWITAAGVESIPHAFVVRNGKLLLGTEASRLTDALIEDILSGDEGAKRAAATVKAAFDNTGKSEDLTKQIRAAHREKDVEKMAAKLSELETLDSGYYEVPGLQLSLLAARKDWLAAAVALKEMPASESKDYFMLDMIRRITATKDDNHPMEFIKALASSHAEYITRGGKRIGPNHFVYVSILHWKIDDKEAAISYADKSVEVATNYVHSVHGNDEALTIACKRFAKLANEGTMPTFKEVLTWQREAAQKKAKAATKK